MEKPKVRERKDTSFRLSPASRAFTPSGKRRYKQVWKQDKI